MLPPPGRGRCAAWLALLGLKIGPGTDSALATLTGCSHEFYRLQQKDLTSQTQRECKAFLDLVIHNL